MHPINEAREWLLSGGGGHEGGEDGLKATTVTGAGLIDFLAAYAAYLRDKRIAEAMADAPDAFKPVFEGLKNLEKTINRMRDIVPIDTRNWKIVDEVYPLPPGVPFQRAE